MRLDLSAPIVPAVGAAGVRLLDDLADIAHDCPPDASGVHPGWAKSWVRYGPVTLTALDGVIVGISLGPGYTGRVDGRVGVGSTVEEAAALGPVLAGRRMLTIDGLPGLGFGSVQPPAGVPAAPDWACDHAAGVIGEVAVWLDVEPWVVS